MRLAVFELKKKSRGAALGYGWFFVKPAVYIFCFWFALDVGLRAGHTDPGAPPYILWLAAGIVPWFFMSNMLSGGIDVLHRYSYLVNKIKFPLSGISTIFTISTFIIQLALMAILVAAYIISGQPLDITLIQIPFLLAMMFMFWDMASILFSQLSAMSKDFSNFMHALSTPFFWLSGVIFNVHAINTEWIQVVLAFNPITFFVSAFRDAIYNHTWFWENTQMLGGFLIVCVVTLFAMGAVYKRLNKEVPDVL